MTARTLVRLATVVIVLALLLLPAAVSNATIAPDPETSLAAPTLTKSNGDSTPSPTGTDSDTVSSPSKSTSDAALRAYRQSQASLRSIRADEVHARGITGEGVRIGVIGGGFAIADSPIRDNLAARQGFGGRSIAPVNADHGTAVAEIVTRTAPGSRLYLASVGNRPTPSQYRAAVHWLLANGVDVIVDAGSYFPGRAGNAITAAAVNASQQGVVFVTSAGNYANRHWSGNGTDSGWIVFDRRRNVQANPLAGGNATRGTVSLHLRWNSSADYDLYLYRQLDNAPDRVVAKSTHRQVPGAPAIEALDVAVPKGQYYAAVYAWDDTAPTDRLHLFSAQHSLGYADAQGSVAAPATSERVIAVGAVDHRGQRRAYSSIGHGDLVDVNAPDGIATRASGPLYGTSAAAPIVAGTAALMESRNRSLSPMQVEHILQQTASGNRVDALAAVRAVSNRTLANVTETEPRSPRPYRRAVERSQR